MRYQAEFRGIAEYYQLAYNRHRLGLLRWVMERSLTKTLGHKHKISVSKVWHRHRATWQTPAGPRRVLQVTVERGDGKKPLAARWGGISLARRTTPVPVSDDLPATWRKRPAELVTRLTAGRCELCQEYAAVETHQVRRLKDLQAGNRADQPGWARQMANTPSQDPDRLPRLPRPHPPRNTATAGTADQSAGERRAVKVACGVRRGATGKGLAPARAPRRWPTQRGQQCRQAKEAGSPGGVGEHRRTGAGSCLVGAPGTGIQAKLHRWAGGRSWLAGSMICSTSSHDPASCWWRGIGCRQQGCEHGRRGWADCRLRRAEIVVVRVSRRLRTEIKDRSFRPLPVRERMIPKPGRAGKLRTLGDSALRTGWSRRR